MNTLTTPLPPPPPPSGPPEYSPPPAPADGPPRRRPGLGRFLAGAAVGAVVGAIVAGGIVAVADDGNGTAAVSTVAPAGNDTAVAGSGNVIDGLVQSAEPSIVSIHDSIAQTDIFGNEVEGQAAGTGFVFDADGYIVTNDHVIDGAEDITVEFSDGSSADATVVAADPNADLAVLKVDHPGLVALPFADSSALHVGDQVVAIGNALDLSGDPTVTTGIVSAVGRTLTEPNGVHLTNLLQTDTAINPGNSGGPLLDLHGRVVGINTAIAGQAQNIGFAIAGTPAHALLDQLRAGKVPEHALLGVSTRAADGGGLTVAEVTDGSAADKAGLRAGDVIVAVDGTPVGEPDDLATVIAGHQPGDQLTVNYRRDGAEHDVTVTLGSRPTG